MSLKDLIPSFSERVPVVMAGNPLVVSMVDHVQDVDATKVAVIYIGAPEAPLRELKEVMLFDFAANPDTGKVDIDLSETLKYLPGLEADFPDLVSTKISALKLVKEMAVTLEFYRENITQRGQTGMEILHVMDAGISGFLEKKYGQNYLSEGFDQTQQFLTHQPPDVPVLSYQDLFLYHLHNLDSEILTLSIQCEHLDGSFTNLPGVPIQAKRYGVYQIPCGPSQLRLPESVRRYEIALVNGSNQRVSEVRTYHIDRTPYENAAVVLFQNSFGVFDSVALIGQTITKTTYESSVSPLLQYSYNKPKSYTTSRLEKVETTYQTGHYPPGWKPYFSELLRSKKVAIVRDGVLMHCNVTTADSELVNTQEPNYSLELTLTSEDSSEYYAL